MTPKLSLYLKTSSLIALVFEQQPVSSSDGSVTIAFVFLTSQCPCYAQVFNSSTTKLRGFFSSKSVLLNHSCFIKASNPDYNYICPFFILKKSNGYLPESEIPTHVIIHFSPRSDRSVSASLFLYFFFGSILSKSNPSMIEPYFQLPNLSSQ